MNPSGTLGNGQRQRQPWSEARFFARVGEARLRHARRCPRVGCCKEQPMNGGTGNTLHHMQATKAFREASGRPFREEHV